MSNTPTPKLSVIMTVYNGEVFVAETVDAVLAQTFPGFEYVIVDNGCTDATMDIITGYDDPRIQVVTADRHGSFGDGIRLAYEHARGEFIAVQDGDDVPALTRFEKQVTALEADPKLGLVSSAFEEIDQDGKRLCERHPPTEPQALIDAYQTHNPLAHSTYMYRKTASDAVGGYPAEYTYGPDFALVIRLLDAGWRVSVLDNVLLKLRQHAGQTSLTPDIAVDRALDEVHLFKEATGLSGASPTAKRAGTRTRTKSRIRYALALIEDGRAGEGLRQLGPTLARHPLYSSLFLAYRLVRWAGLQIPARS